MQHQGLFKNNDKELVEFIKVAEKKVDKAKLKPVVADDIVTALYCDDTYEAHEEFRDHVMWCIRKFKGEWDNFFTWLTEFENYKNYCVTCEHWCDFDERLEKDYQYMLLHEVVEPGDSLHVVDPDEQGAMHYYWKKCTLLEKKTIIVAAKEDFEKILESCVQLRELSGNGMVFSAERLQELDTYIGKVSKIVGVSYKPPIAEMVQGQLQISIPAFNRGIHRLITSYVVRY
jgi:hypothetical protein